MQLEGIIAETEAYFRWTSTTREDIPAVANLGQGKFHADQPNRVWASDITLRWHPGFTPTNLTRDRFAIDGGGECSYEHTRKSHRWRDRSAILDVMRSRISHVIWLLLPGLVGASIAACGSNNGGTSAEDGAAGSSPGVAGTSGNVGTVDATGVAGLAVVDAGAPNVVPTPGCGHDPGQAPGMLIPGMIQTTGVKDPDCADTQCGAWSSLRDYWMSLPPDYDNTKAYPLVLEGPGCGEQGNNLYNIPALSDAAIRVGLSPSAEVQAFHPISPGQGCFDDMEGDDSVDWVFYENLYDKLAAEVCFDRNRVFAAGTSSGARMANELGCKYAGDALRPVRGVMSRGSGLPVDPKYQPTCTTKSMAGMWVDEVGNSTFVFAESTLALTRAMRLNGCTIGNSYETAQFDAFSISATDSTSCEMVKGCSTLFPLVICPLQSYSTRAGDQTVVVPGWMAFVKLFDP